MDPKALEALPEEKTTKMELKRGQVGLHWSTNKFQQRWRIQLNSIQLKEKEKAWLLFPRQSDMVVDLGYN